MPRNPWLAIDSSTAPLELARDLRRSWERFLTGEEVDAVRAPIVASWQRSQVAGVDPCADRVAPTLNGTDEVAARWQVHPLAAAAPLIRDCLGEIAEESEHLIVISDDEGTLLWVEGNNAVRDQAAETMNFIEGASWNERHAGTNAVGTALEGRHAVQVFAAEHFNEAVQPWTCAAAPIHDPDTGRLLGIIDLTGRAATAHPHTLASAISTARAVEAQLRLELEERSSRLRARYGDLVTAGGRRALLAPGGRVLIGSPDGWLGVDRLAISPGGGELMLPSGLRAFVEPVGQAEAYVVRADAPHRTLAPPDIVKLELLDQDRPVIVLGERSVRLTSRHAEILAILTLRGRSLTSEELAADLYGDGGQPVAARVQISRLRKVLGGGIDPATYRLMLDVESDVAVVRSLLDRGEVRGAAERYPGPILPHSEAPGVVREREALDAWVRHAVMTAGDVEALWAWLQSSSGADDLPAWKRLLAELDFSDPRRPQAVGSVTALRSQLARGAL